VIATRRWHRVEDRDPVILHPVIVMYPDGRQIIAEFDGERWSLPRGEWIDTPQYWEDDCDGKETW